jgi:hypothetical protein
MSTALLHPFGNLILDVERRCFLSENRVCRKRIYTPDVTLIGFLRQVSDPSGSCQTAVNGIHAQNSSKNRSTASLNTSSYTRARARLSIDSIKNLAKSVDKSTTKNAEESWLWKGRLVSIIDGSTIMMADTPENVALFPKRKNQQEHNGYPLARLMISSTLETGTITNFCMAPSKGKGTGEITLGKKLLEGITPENVLIADAMFVTYSFISLCQDKGLDFLAPKKNNRKYQILHEEIIGPGDKIIRIKKPRRPITNPTDEDNYDQQPDAMTLRETKIAMERNGFRTSNLTVLSTFLDHEKYSKDDLIRLYLGRWNIELDLRIIKRELGMKFLSCKTPAMVEKEIWVYLLAYNLVRRLLSLVARKSGLLPRKLSFKNTLDYYLKSVSASNPNLIGRMPAEFVQAISRFKVGKQPGRFEPRARKTSCGHNDFPSLTITRNQWKLLQLMPYLMELGFSSAFIEGIERLKATIPTVNGKPKY